MSTRRTRTSLGTAITIAALLLGCATWWFAWRNEPRVEDTTKATTHDATSPPDAVAANAPLDANASSTTTASPSRDRAVEATPPPPTDTTPPAVLHVRLRGLHPDAPWTSPLRLDTEDAPWITPSDLGIDGAQQRVREPRPSATVDANGRAQFEMAGALRNVTKGAIRGDDPNYSRLGYAFNGPLDFANELVLDVQVVAGFDGRVIDSHGAPAWNTKIAVFAMRDGQPADVVLTQTAPDPASGRYSFRAPPGAPLLVVAVPGDGSIQLPEFRPNSEGAKLTIDLVHRDLLPASVTTHGSVGERTTVPDLVMQDAVMASGLVRWADGAPIAGVTIHASGDAPASLTVGGAGVRVLDDKRLSPSGPAVSKADGSFALPAIAGVPVVLRAVSIDGALLVGEPVTRNIVPPQHVEFVFPRPIELRVTNAGAPVSKASVEFEFASWRTSADTNGALRAVVLVATKVRASKDTLRSAWIDVSPALSGSTVAIELRETLTSVSIDLEGGADVREAVVGWQSADGRQGHLRTKRPDGRTPFLFAMEPGRHHLRFREAADRASFLLPIELDVDSGSGPVQLVVTAVFGGQMSLSATDANGVHVAGTCRVIDGSGVEIQDRFLRERDGQADVGGTGEILAGGPNRFGRILPPGVYELQCDFVEHGARRTKVTIEPRKVAEVRIRL